MFGSLLDLIRRPRDLVLAKGVLGEITSERSASREDQLDLRIPKGSRTREKGRCSGREDDPRDRRADVDKGADFKQDIVQKAGCPVLRKQRRSWWWYRYP